MGKSVEDLVSPGKEFSDKALDYLKALYSALPSKPKSAREKAEYLGSIYSIEVPRLDPDIKATLKILEFYHLTKMGIL